MRKTSGTLSVKRDRSSPSLLMISRLEYQLNLASIVFCQIRCAKSEYSSLLREVKIEPSFLSISGNDWESRNAPQVTWDFMIFCSEFWSRVRSFSEEAKWREAWIKSVLSTIAESQSLFFCRIHGRWAIRKIRARIKACIRRR